MQIEIILKSYGLSKKETEVLLSLIELGPSSVRLVSDRAGVNRGTTYDILKSLIGQGLVSYHKNKSRRPDFMGPEPDKR